MTDNAALTSVSVWVNGELRPCASATSLTQYLEHLGFNPRLVAVEYNGEILQRPHWPTTFIQANDRLEVVTIVGGG